MKILKNGVMPVTPTRTFRGTCTKCGCQVECDEKEVQSYGERHFGGTYQYWVQCPYTVLSWKCENKIVLEEVIYRT